MGVASTAVFLMNTWRGNLMNKHTAVLVAGRAMKYLQEIAERGAFDGFWGFLISR
jgi:hypothetical protein